MTSFWSGYITLLTIGTLVALVWLSAPKRHGDAAAGGGAH